MAERGGLISMLVAIFVPEGSAIETLAVLH
jgi:hypothetical protein